MLRPEVAEKFELTTGSTRVHVIALGRDYDLTRITLAQAEELVAVPGFDRLRRKVLPGRAAVAAPKKARPAVDAAGLGRAKKNKGG